MKKNTPISKEDLLRYRAKLIRKVWHDIYIAFEQRNLEDGLKKTDIAERLGVHKSVISRRLNGSSNITLEVLSDMCRALDYIPDINLKKIEEICKNNNQLYEYTQTICPSLSHSYDYTSTHELNEREQLDDTIEKTFVFNINEDKETIYVA